MSGLLRKFRNVLSAAGLMLGVAAAPARATPDAQVSAIVPYVDLHVDLPYQHNFKQAEVRTGTGQFAGSLAAQGGLLAVVFPLFVPFRVSAQGPRMADYEASWQQFEHSLSQQSLYASPGSEPKAGQIRTFYSFEGMSPFTEDRKVLLRWMKRGVRLFGLVHNQHNALAAAAMDRRGADFGLTKLGRRVVKAICELGGIVDTSHASDRATRDVLSIAEKLGKPVVASHSNARRLLKHPRNLSDELMTRIARTGGIIGVNFHSRFLTKRRRATLADVVDQVTYLVSRVGPDHVAIGSDFEGDIRPPVGLATLGDVQQLARALEASGMASADVKAIFGENALRLLMPALPNP